MQRLMKLMPALSSVSKRWQQMSNYATNVVINDGGITYKLDLF